MIDPLSITIWVLTAKKIPNTFVVILSFAYLCFMTILILSSSKSR